MHKLILLFQFLGSETVKILNFQNIFLIFSSMYTVSCEFHLGTNTNLQLRNLCKLRLRV